MKIDDLRKLEISGEIETDLCIVGSGPAGLTVAGELIGTGTRILILESGGLVEEAVVDSLGEIESVGEPRIMEQTLFRNRVFGGTSHSWTGRCAPFDDIDFAKRPWIPFSGWPMRRSQLEPFIHRASEYLGIRPAHYDERLVQDNGCPILSSDLDRENLRNCFWQFSSDSRKPLDYMRFGPAFLCKNPPNASVLLHATVSHITTDGGRVVALEVSTPENKRAIVKSRAVVLCGGGIDNARMLLYSNRVVAGGVGNRHDLVGRFLMDHPRCALAEFDPRSSAEVGDYYGLFRLGKNGDRRTFLQGITLSPKMQKREGLLNCAAWLTEHWAPDDPWSAMKRLLSGDHRRPAQDAWSVLSQPGFVARGVKDRLLRGKGVPHKLQRLVLDCIVEQRPDPESRLMLGEKTDRLGLPLARLDWRISEQEKVTMAAFGNLICREFARVGLPVPELVDWAANHRLDEARFVDVCHPTGTTRMADDPRAGVVDRTCQVHDVEGLFIAGSSVFPTSGHANPTLMIVALAIRLADTLKSVLR
jgi:choline dehydrogenase-like flavoprotein